LGRRAAETPRPAFWTLLAQAPSYPFRGRGKYMLIGAGVTFFVLMFVRAFLWIPVVGLMVLVGVYAYLIAYLFDLIGDSANGEDSPPGWPDLEFFSEGLWSLLLLLAVLALYVGGPMLLAYAFHGSWEDMPAWKTMLARVAGVLLTPMAVLSLALHQSPKPLNPLHVILSIVRVFPAYLAACGMLVGLVFAWELAMSRLEGVTLLAAPVADTISFYVMMVAGRALGLIYYCNERRLDWF
jgi:hypothetical protein